MCLDIDMSHICVSDEDDGTSKPSEKVNISVKKMQKVYEDDDEEETIEYIVENLPADLKPLKECMMNAQGCCLLLILKQFLKEVYSINDGYFKISQNHDNDYFYFVSFFNSRKIQNYSPNDSAKINDKPIGSRKTNYKFNPKQIIEYLKQSNKIIDNNEFKYKLAKEYIEVKIIFL